MKLFRKKREEEEAKKRRICELVSSFGGTLLLFQYDRKAFGNMIAVVECNGQNYEFATDRGEIYCNNKFICNDTYHIAGKDDTIEKLLEIISLTLSEARDEMQKDNHELSISQQGGMLAAPNIQIIKEILGSYLKEDDVRVYISNGMMKYVIPLRDYVLEVQYELVDNFYRVKLEEWKNNQIEQTCFLSKSKKFHKALKRKLRNNGLSKKMLVCHIACICEIVQEQLCIPNGLHDFQGLYIPDMKFDGVFL